MCTVTSLCVCHDSLILSILSALYVCIIDFLQVPWLVYVYHDEFVCALWLFLIKEFICTGVPTFLQVPWRGVTQVPWLIRVPWRIFLCAMTPSFLCYYRHAYRHRLLEGAVTHACVYSDSCVRVPWLLCVCAMTSLCVCHDSFMCLPSISHPFIFVYSIYLCI